MAIALPLALKFVGDGEGLGGVVRHPVDPALVEPGLMRE